MNKKIYIFLGAIALVGFSGYTAYAAPQHHGDNVVAHYEDGPHGIVGDYYLHEGMDIVTRSGGSGNFQQWFEGTTAMTGDAIVGKHSVWKWAKNGKCPSDPSWILVPNASASWGDYLVAGADYCVKTNVYNP